MALRIATGAALTGFTICVYSVFTVFTAINGVYRPLTGFTGQQAIWEPEKLYRPPYGRPWALWAIATGGAGKVLLPDVTPYSNTGVT